MKPLSGTMVRGLRVAHECGSVIRSGGFSSEWGTGEIIKITHNHDGSASEKRGVNFELTLIPKEIIPYNTWLGLLNRRLVGVVETRYSIDNYIGFKFDRAEITEEGKGIAQWYIDNHPDYWEKAY